MTGGVCLNAKKNGQIGESDVVRDDWNAGSTTQPACGFRGTRPYAIVHAIPEFIWGMSAKKAERFAPENWDGKGRRSRQPPHIPRAGFRMGPIFRRRRKNALLSKEGDS